MQVSEEQKHQMMAEIHELVHLVKLEFNSEDFVWIWRH